LVPGMLVIGTNRPRASGELLRSPISSATRADIARLIEV
jgi:hypothetical protein